MIYHLCFHAFVSIHMLYCASSGYTAWIGNYAQTDSVLVEILYELGAVPFVRTNVPQTLMVCIFFAVLSIAFAAFYARADWSLSSIYLVPAKLLHAMIILGGSGARHTTMSSGARQTHTTAT